MGGQSAKNRRKLQRQQQQQQQDGEPAESANQEEQQNTGATGRKQEKQTTRPDQTKKRVLDKSSTAKRDTMSSVPRKKQKTASDKTINKNGKKKDKKIKKPKHLKRKLENATDNAELRDQLLQEFRSFEAQKAKRVHSSLKKKEKPSDGENSEFTDSRRNNNQENGSSVVNESTESTNKPEDFPRVTTQPFDGPSGTSTMDTDKTERKEEGEEASQPPPSSEKEQPSGVKVDDDAGSSSSSSDSDSDSGRSGDEEDDEAPQQLNQRTRGRGRRGRKDTSQRVQEENSANETQKNLSNPEDASKDSKKINDDDNKKKQDGKKRYCLGRKPVTDFAVGESYPGKVVYMKPFGVFFDIGCHSDAFCHISRLSDDYVEKPEQLFKEGDTVAAVRILELDRKTKRITVSLQSSARISDEMASIEARTKRKAKLKTANKTGSKLKSAGTQMSSWPADVAQNPSSSFSTFEKAPASSSHVRFTDGDDEEGENEPKSTSSGEAKAMQSPTTDKPESEMNPAELKRARKLARRAARRARKEETQTEA